MSSPKPTPTRRGTLFGLRRKSSVASMAPATETSSSQVPEPSTSLTTSEAATASASSPFSNRPLPSS
ncbi:hypothetical protein NMY22_g2066 [Coprinellus aureogranulatus]|nr:hypothetical protein NMY22_g2066 [Coprinellus aureogranulatus]